MDKKKVVLVAEDEEDLCDTIADKLESEGIATTKAYNGVDAIETALSVKPDLILLDLVMPGIDGFAVLDRLRDDDWGKSADVIVLTNLDDIDSAARIVDERGYEYLVKTDWKLEDVVAKVKTHLKL